jgi:hypothetical protein
MLRTAYNNKPMAGILGIVGFMVIRRRKITA